MTSARRRSTIPTRICSGSPRTHRCSPSSSLGPSRSLRGRHLRCLGSGKTTFANLLVHYLRRQSGWSELGYIPFSAWPYVTADAIWRALLERIAREVYRQELRRPEGTFDGGDWIARLRAALVVDAFPSRGCDGSAAGTLRSAPRTLRPRRCAREPEPRPFSGGDCEPHRGGRGRGRLGRARS